MILRLPVRWPLLAPLLVFLPLSGCDLSTVLTASSAGTPEETFAVLAATATSSETVSGQAVGHNFDDAAPLDVPALGQLSVQNALATTLDIHVYSFGPVDAGDLIVVDVSAPTLD